MSGILDRVARHHTVFAFDRPEYGFNDRPQGSMWTAEHQADLLSKTLSRPADSSQSCSWMRATMSSKVGRELSAEISIVWYIPPAIRTPW
jgi:hypothetical protein